MPVITQEDIKEDILEDDENPKCLVVFNDDFNTFEHVINTLIKVCKHEPDQAEQCTYIIHYKGKCVVRKGIYRILKPMREGITNAGIKADIR